MTEYGLRLDQFKQSILDVDPDNACPDLVLAMQVKTASVLDSVIAHVVAQIEVTEHGRRD